MGFGSKSKPADSTSDPTTSGGSGADAAVASVADAPPPSGGVEANTAAGLALPSADMEEPPPLDPDADIDIDSVDIDTFSMAREVDRPDLPDNAQPIRIEKSGTIEQAEAGIDPSVLDYWLGLMPNSHHSTIVLGGIAFHYQTVRNAGSNGEMPLRGSIVKLSDKQVKLITAQASRKVFRSRGGAYSIYDTASPRYQPRAGDRCVARDIFMIPMPPSGQRGPFWNEARPVAMLTD